MSNFLLQSAAAAEFIQQTRKRLLAEGYVETGPDTFEKRGTTMLTLPETCITEGFVMPKWQESSFPLLALARERNLDYGDVCLAADHYIKCSGGRYDEVNNWERDALSRLAGLGVADAISEIGSRMPRARAVQ